MENKIREAMCHLDADLVQEAALPVTQKKHKFRTLLVAACLTALCIVGVAAASGGLLVRFYHNGNLPDHIAAEKVDAYYNVTGNNKVTPEDFSEELLALAAEQGPGSKVYPFETLEEMEAFLGYTFPENAILRDARPVSVKMTDQNNEVIHDSPGSVLLHNDQEGRLTVVKADYYCQTQSGKRVFLTAAAATVNSPSGSVGSMSVDYEGGEVLQQKAETYLTASGRECTIVSTQNSLTEGWDVYSWIEQDGFVLSLSLDGHDESVARAEMKQILDAFQ